MKHLSAIVILLLIILTEIAAQTDPRLDGLKAINQDALKAQMNFLASDLTEGRETGEYGDYLSAEYIASMLQLFGAEPAGDELLLADPGSRSLKKTRSYFQTFALQKNSPGKKQSFSIKISDGISERIIDFTNESDFRLTPVYPGGKIESEIIFVGYGYRNDKEKYNDFSKLDVKGKFILRLAGMPPEIQGSENPYASYYLSREKNELASSLGVAGIIEVDPADNGSDWTEKKEYMNLSPAEIGRRRIRGARLSIPGTGISDQVNVISISKRVADIILSFRGTSIDAYTSGMQITSSATAKISAVLTTEMNSSLIQVRNVIGMIEGKNKDEVIILGAHYDHLGIHDGYVYNGADDNASGTIGVLTIARAIAASGIQPERTIIFALWTGEEKGLLGSKYFCKNPTIHSENIVLNKNFDMISRYASDDQPDKVTISWSPDCPDFKALSVKNINKYNLDLDPDYLETEKVPGGSDHLPFLNEGIPAMRYKPGHREEYHTPADEIETIDWDIFEKIVKLAFLNTLDAAGADF